MSYILDALRRAQAERERGQVPGLEARTMVQTPPPPARSRATGWWLGGALAVLALGGAAVLWLRGVAPSVTPAVTLASAPLPSPARSASSPATPATAATPTPIVVVSAPAVPPPFPGPVTALPPPVAPAPTVLPAPPAPAPSTPPATTVAPAASTVRAVQLAQLSADLRRELPALALGGTIWSDNAASRFVIVNGQVLREGETAAPGVVLERIGPKAVFLRWRDWRIEVPI